MPRWSSRTDWAWSAAVFACRRGLVAVWTLRPPRLIRTRSRRSAFGRRRAGRRLRPWNGCLVSDHTHDVRVDALSGRHIDRELAVLGVDLDGVLLPHEFQAVRLRSRGDRSDVLLNCGAGEELSNLRGAQRSDRNRMRAGGRFQHHRLAVAEPKAHDVTAVEVRKELSELVGHAPPSRYPARHRRPSDSAGPG